jgi:hypothetical protein
VLDDGLEHLHQLLLLSTLNLYYDAAVDFFSSEDDKAEEDEEEVLGTPGNHSVKQLQLTQKKERRSRREAKDRITRR